MRSTTASSAKTSVALQQTTNLMDELGRSAGLSARRFLAFSIVSNGIIDVATALKTAVVSALQYNREFVKLSQVGEAYRSDLVALNSEITRLSTNFGVSSQELLRSAVTLRQAGLNVSQVTNALETLAKARLAPSFGNDIDKVAKGMIAISSQFRIFDRDLANAVSAINAVSNAFSVESQEIITAIQRTGGAFRSIGGDVNEFIALFTSVSSTTRESAEAIGTGLRTIFGRVQRPETVDNLRELGINLRYTREEAEALGNINLAEQFVGGYEAVRRLSQAVQSLPATDERFARIVENVGGLRQLSRVIPLLQEFGTAQNAYNIAVSGGASLTVAADIAQQNFLVNLEKLKESFLGLTRNIVNSQGFAVFTDTIIRLGNSMAYLLSQISPLVPLLTTIATIRIASGFGSFLTGFRGGFHSQRINSGGRVGFATGGVVPGIGNSDTVPANLTPGEFVIKKSSAQAIGYDALSAMNGGGRAGFAGGGSVDSIRRSIFKVTADYLNKTGVNLSKGYRQLNLYSSSELQGIAGKNAKAFYESGTNIIGLDANNPQIESTFIHEALHGIDRLKGLEKGFSGLSYSDIPDTAISRHIGKLRGYILPRIAGVPDNLKNYLSDSGEILAHSGQGILGYPDTPNSVFASLLSPASRAAITRYAEENIIPKLKTNDSIENYPLLKPNSRLFRTGTKLFANGGSAGTDTVPALLTPGEFVFNKIAAQKIGYNTLHHMNKTGQIQKFATGGRVNRADGTPSDFLNGETADEIFDRLAAQFGIFTGLRRGNNRGSPFLLGNVKAPLGNPFQYDSPIGPQRASFGNFGSVSGYGGGYGAFPSDLRYRSPSERNIGSFEYRNPNVSPFTIRTDGPSSDPIQRLLQQIANNTGKSASASSSTSSSTQSIEAGSGLKDKLLGLAAFALIGGAGYLSDAINQSAGTAQNAAIGGGGRNFVGLRATSGAITTGLATGFAGFQIGGPLGAVAGGLLGAGIGGVGSANQARSELASARAEESQRRLSEVLTIITGRGTGAIGASDSDTISQSIAEGFEQIRQKAIADNQRLYIFGTDTSAASAQEIRERRIFASSQVASATGVLGLSLNERAREVGRSNLTPQQIRDQLNPTALRGSFSAPQLDLVRLISQGSGQSEDEIFQRLSRQVTQQTLQERTRLVTNNNSIVRDSITIQFDRLASIIERVNVEFQNFNRVLDVNSSLFEGRFSQGRFPNIPNSSNLFGLGENGDFIRGIGGALGSGGRQFEQFGLAFDDILQRLFPVIASNFNQFSPTQQQDFPEIIRSALDAQLGGRNNLNASQISILSEVDSNLRRLANDNDTLRRLIQSGNRQDLNRELTRDINFPQNADRIAREFSEAANEFSAAAQRFEQRNIELANARSQGFVFNRNAEAFQARAEFLQNGIDPTGLQGVLPLDRANLPIRRRAELLATSIGLNANQAENPRAIGARQQQIDAEIRRIEERRAGIVNIRDPQYRQLTLQLRELERQSIQAGQALQDLANGARNQAAQERLATLVRGRENRISFAERVVTSTPAELAQRRLANVQFQRLVESGRNITDLPPQVISEIFNNFRQQGNIPITELGATPAVIARLTQRYGVDASNLTGENIIAQELRRDPRAGRFVNQTDNEINRVIQEIANNNNIQIAAQQEIVGRQERLQTDFFASLNQVFDRFFNNADVRQAQDSIRAARDNLSVVTGTRDRASERVADRNLLRDRFGIGNQSQLQAITGNIEQLIGANNTINSNRELFRNLRNSQFNDFTISDRAGSQLTRTDSDRSNIVAQFLRGSGIDIPQETVNQILREMVLSGREVPGLTRINEGLNLRNNNELRQGALEVLNNRPFVNALDAELARRNIEPNRVLTRARQVSGIRNEQLIDLIQTVQNNPNFRQRIEAFRGNGNESLDNVDRVLREATDAYNRANVEVNRFAQTLRNLNNGINFPQQQAATAAAGIGAFVGLGAAGFLGTRQIQNNPIPPALDLGPAFNPNNAQIPPPGLIVGPQANVGGGPGGIAGVFNAAQNLLAAQATATVQAGQNFAQELNPFIDALRNFPQELTGSFTHTVNLNINGAEALQGIEETMKEYVVAQTKEVVRRYIKDNLHEAGQLI